MGNCCHTISTVKPGKIPKFLGDYADDHESEGGVPKALLSNFETMNEDVCEGDEKGERIEKEHRNVTTGIRTEDSHVASREENISQKKLELEESLPINTREEEKEDIGVDDVLLPEISKEDKSKDSPCERTNQILLQFDNLSIEDTSTETGVLPDTILDETVQFCKDFERKFHNGEVFNDLVKVKKDELLDLLGKNDVDLSEKIFLISELFLDISRYRTSLRFLSVGLKCVTTKSQFGRYLREIGMNFFKLGEYDKASVFYQRSLDIALEFGNKKEEGKLLFRIGDIGLNKGSYDDANRYFEKSLVIFQGIGDKSGEGNSLDRMGRVLFMRGDYSKAKEFFEDSLNLFRDLGEKIGEGNLLINIGLIHNYRGDYSKAIEYYEKSLEIKREIGDKEGEGTTLINLGSIHNSRGDYSNAMEYFEKSLEIKREIGDKKGEGSTLCQIGSIHLSRGDYSKAMEYYEKSLDIRRRIGDKKGEGSTLCQIGSIHLSRGDYSKAMEYFEKSLDIRRGIGDKNGEGSTLCQIGSIHHSRGDYSNAMEYYEKSLEIRKEIGDKNGEGTTLGNIGGIHYSRGDYSNAMEYYEKSLEIRREIGDKNGEGATLNYMGGIYNALYRIGGIHDSRGDYSKAMEYYEKSLEIRREIGDREGEGTTLNNIGLAHKSRGDYSKAMEYYEKSLEINRVIGDKKGEGTTLNNIGGIHYSRGDYSKALEFFEKSILIKREIGDKNGEAITLFWVGHLNKEQKKLQQSLREFGVAKKLYESMKLFNNVREVEESIKLVEIEVEKEKHSKLEEEIKNTTLKDYKLSERLGKNPLNPFGYDGANSVVMECRLKRNEDIALAMKILFNYKTSDGDIEEYIKTNLLNCDQISKDRLPWQYNIMRVLHAFPDKIVREVFKHEEHFLLFQEEYIAKRTGFLVNQKYCGDLKQYVLQRKGELFSETDILVLIRGILSGVCHLHENSLVHRDLKPDNVLLTEKGNTVIADFGCHLDLRLPEDNSSPGTPYYLPPEAFINLNPNFRKSDVFSTGIILYFLITCGNDQAWGNSRKSDETFKMIKSDKYSVELKELVRKMLLVDFEKRLQCDECLEIVEDLIKKIEEEKMKAMFSKK